MWNLAVFFGNFRCGIDHFVATKGAGGGPGLTSRILGVEFGRFSGEF